MFTPRKSLHPSRRTAATTKRLTLAQIERAEDHVASVQRMLDAKQRSFSRTQLEDRCWDATFSVASALLREVARELSFARMEARTQEGPALVAIAAMSVLRQFRSVGIPRIRELTIGLQLKNAEANEALPPWDFVSNTPAPGLQKDS